MPHHLSYQFSWSQGGQLLPREQMLMFLEKLSEELDLQRRGVTTSGIEERLDRLELTLEILTALTVTTLADEPQP